MAGEGYTKKMAYDDLFHGIIENIVYPRDKVYSDKNLYNEALEEAARRKSENMKNLYRADASEVFRESHITSSLILPE